MKKSHIVIIIRFVTACYFVLLGIALEFLGLISYWLYVRRNETGTPLFHYIVNLFSPIFFLYISWVLFANKKKQFKITIGLLILEIFYLLAYRFFSVNNHSFSTIDLGNILFFGMPILIILGIWKNDSSKQIEQLPNDGVVTK